MSDKNEMEFIKKHLARAIDLLDLPPATKKLLVTPEREVQARLTLKRDDGKTLVLPAYRVTWNSACGPAKGGLRFHPSETSGMVRKLAALMAWKTAVLGLPLGGAKGGVKCDIKDFSTSEKERLCRAYVGKFFQEFGSHKDVPAPDVYVDSQMIGWMLDEYEQINGAKEPGAITGKPLVLGGSEARSDATARGGMYLLRGVARELEMDLSEKTVAIQGYGNAGSHAHRLAEKILDLQVVAVSDSSGGIYNPEGLNYAGTRKCKQRTGTVVELAAGEEITNRELLTLDVDILIPAALGAVITDQNAGEIQAEIILELANGPTTYAADKILARQNILVLPDMLANAGGVTVSYFEQVQNSANYYWSKKEVTEKLDRMMVEALQRVLQMREEKETTTRQATYLVAVKKIYEAMKLRGWL